MTKAFILINLKTYSEGAGQRAHNIAGAAEQVADESGVLIALAPSYMNIHRKGSAEIYIIGKNHVSMHETEGSV